MGDTAAKSYVRMDEHGVMRVGGTRVMIDGIVYAFYEGNSPESIRESYPGLSLTEVYGAITYYLENKADVDAYLRQQQQAWEKLREEIDQHPSAHMQRLRALAEAQKRQAV